MRITGWTLVGVGVVAAGASAVLAWQAHNIQEELNTDTTWTRGPATTRADRTPPWRAGSGRPPRWPEAGAPRC